MDKVLKSGEMYEECLALTTGDRLDYSFNANKPLVFNIHYHVDEDIFYPVKDALRSLIADELQVSADHRYCLMWTNRSRSRVELNARYKKLPKQ